MTSALEAAVAELESSLQTLGPHPLVERVVARLRAGDSSSDALRADVQALLSWQLSLQLEQFEAQLRELERLEPVPAVAHARVALVRISELATAAMQNGLEPALYERIAATRRAFLNVAEAMRHTVP